MAKTSRALITHQSQQSFGWGAEVAARIYEECYYDLDGPVVRVGGADVPSPAAKELEHEVLPSADKIVAACNRALERASA
jgi:pyruvate/2-oxoglutarate/acetoin dehydrogenase E1 component